MNFKNIKNEKWFPYTVATCSAVLFAFILQHIGIIGTFGSTVVKMASPLVAGVVIAYLVNPIAIFVEKQLHERFKTEKLGWKSSVGIAFGLVGLVLILLMAALIPQIVNSVTGLFGNLDSYEESLAELVSGSQGAGSSVSDTLKNITDKINEIVPKVTDAALENSQNVGSTLANIGLGFILAIYFLLDKKKIMPWLTKICQKAARDKYEDFIEFCSKCNRIILRYVSCSVLEAFIVGLSNAIFMLIFRMPYIALISLVVGVTNLAPTFGPIIGAVIGIVVLVLVRPRYAVYFLLFTLVIQTIDGYIIKPKLFGNSLGVSSLWILIAIILGGKLVGVVGVLLAIPFAAIVQYFLEDILFPKQRSGEINMPWDRHRDTKEEKNEEN